MLCKVYKVKKIKEIISSYISSQSKQKSSWVPEEIFMLSVMETYSWTYDQYINTPVWIIDLIAAKNTADVKLNKLKNEK